MSRSRDVFGALADPTRRVILERLLDRHEMSAGALAAEFSHISRPAVSKHLGVLRAAGLVRAREDGREVFYALDPAPLAAAYEDVVGAVRAALGRAARPPEAQRRTGAGDRPAPGGGVRARADGRRW